MVPDVYDIAVTTQVDNVVFTVNPSTELVTIDVTTTADVVTFEVNEVGQKGDPGSLILAPTLIAETYTGLTRTGIAGQNLAFGDLVYLSNTGWKLCDANSALGATGDSRGLIGMCVAAALSGLTSTILLHGIVKSAAFPAMTINAVQYVSEVPGRFVEAQPVTPDVVIRVVGTAISSNELYFNPSADHITHV